MMVLPKVVAAVPELMVVFPARVTAPVRPMVALLVVMLAVTVEGPLTLMAFRAVVPPTAPVKVVAPVLEVVKV